MKNPPVFRSKGAQIWTRPQNPQSNTLAYTHSHTHSHQSEIVNISHGCWVRALARLHPAAALANHASAASCEPGRERPDRLAGVETRPEPVEQVEVREEAIEHTATAEGRLVSADFRRI